MEERLWSGAFFFLDRYAATTSHTLKARNLRPLNFFVPGLRVPLQRVRAELRAAGVRPREGAHLQGGEPGAQELGHRGFVGAGSAL